MAENKTLEHLPEVRAAVAALSPEDRELLEAVQASPFKLTAPEQFKEFADNIDYFVFEPNIRDLNDLGWRYLAQHMDMLLPPELLSAILYNCLLSVHIFRRWLLQFLKILIPILKI